jgi:hypothetical protein
MVVATNTRKHGQRLMNNIDRGENLMPHEVKRTQDSREQSPERQAAEQQRQEQQDNFRKSLYQQSADQTRGESSSSHGQHDLAAQIAAMWKQESAENQQAFREKERTNSQRERAERSTRREQRQKVAETQAELLNFERRVAGRDDHPRF